MRAAFALVLLSACAPEIAGGAYFCGDEQSCPENLACDGVTNMCELPNVARPFACGDELTEVEPNNSFGAAQSFGELLCPSALIAIAGCNGGDNSTEDFYSFRVAPGCPTARFVAKISFPIAFEPLQLELRDDGGSVRATSEPCAPDDHEDGVADACLEVPVSAGGQFAVRVTGAGTANCDGACSFNRYTMNMQVR